MFTIFSNKILFYLITSASVVLFLMVSYFGWKHKIELDALDKYNKVQIEQNIKDQKKYLDLQLGIQKNQYNTVKGLNESNNKLNKELDSIEKKIPQSSTDKQSSPIIKQTLEELNKLND